uniref:Metalloendopeptidase n=1 Tax=Haemonchus contortus TaxID=6289 RepID=A0A7I4YFX8_HAECO
MIGSTQNGMIFYNALKNKQLIWKNGIIPYEMDPAFFPHERKIIEKAFASYRKSTCIRFEPRTDEPDYLNIVKGYGCYSQVGRTGGKQEISLGRGCLFHEIIVHELMHSVGFWHEHSRADRDDHIHIRWDNILPGMKSQFDKISAALQDTQGEQYDYRSIMHYDSTAFSRNGKNTIETVVEGFTDIIGSSVDLSELDIVKINKLYKCSARNEEPKTTTATTTTTGSPPPHRGRCIDHFSDCPHFKQYCQRASFFFVMKSYCPLTCGHCGPTKE